MKMTSHGFRCVCSLLRAVLSVLLNNKYVGLVHVTQSVTRGTWANKKSVFTRTHEVWELRYFHFIQKHIFIDFDAKKKKCEHASSQWPSSLSKFCMAYQQRSISLNRPPAIIKANCTRAQPHHSVLVWIERDTIWGRCYGLHYTIFLSNPNDVKTNVMQRPTTM